MTTKTSTERMDEVADRLAAQLAASLTELRELRRHTPMDNDQAAAALAQLLQERSIQLNDALLVELVRKA